MSNFMNKSRWLIAALIALTASQVFGHGMSEAEKQAIIEGGNLSYIWIGATHMLSGYDHLAFVFGIVFFLTKFRDIVKYITAFTIGHSITLIYATFNAIQINYFLIDAVIALSVCYIAFSNLDGFKKYLKINPPSMMLMITSLGLIHGLGLSTRLQQLPLNQDQLLMNIISFNIGIEFGQIAALTIMLFLLTLLRKSKSFQPISLIANYSLIFLGLYLFLMQMHDYSHATSLEEPATSIASEATLEQLPNTMKQEETKWKDVISVEIPARGDREYKLHLTKGASLQYFWQTDGEMLFFDFHGEPTGDTTGFFKSFRKNTLNQSSGNLTSEFDGTHGWYWKNNSNKPVVITLKVAGEYSRLDLKKQPRHHNSID